jgi:hypothetical protein
MNLLDFFIIITLIGVFAGAFMVDIWRSLGTLIALFAGVIGPDAFGATVGSLLSRWISGMSPWTAELVGFLLSLLIVTAATLYVLVRSFRAWGASHRRRLEYQGGFPLLLAIMSVAVVVKAGARTVGRWPPQETSTLEMRQFRESALLPATIEVSAHTYSVTASWIPGSTPSLIAPAN